MFKKLRERIAEEANRLPVGQIAFGNNTTRPYLPPRIPENSEDHITSCDSSSVFSPQSQFSIDDDEQDCPSEQSTPQKKLENSPAGSDLFSTPNSSAKDHTKNISNTPGAQKSPNSQYIPQTDIESEVEEPPTLNLDGISKDQLMSTIQTLKARLYKYKNKYSEVVNAFKAMDEEKKKLEHALTENQDKSLRRIAELREQCQLEQKAKAHLEENLRLILEEKDSRISVLETQINLLKEGQSENVSETSVKTLIESCDTVSEEGNESAVSEKVSQLCSLLKECEATIAAQREQMTEMTNEKESLVEQLDSLQKASEELKNREMTIRSDHEVVLENLKKQLNELQKQQEDSVMSMAETKRNMHEELELKERQINKLKEETRQFQSALEVEKSAILILQKQHDEKVRELQNQLETMEKTMEEEKENLIRDFSRGKAEAVALMQQESSKKSASLEDEWKAKMQNLKEENANALQKKVEELKLVEDQLCSAKQEISSLVKNVEKVEKEKENLASLLEDMKQKEKKLQEEKHELLSTRKETEKLERKIHELEQNKADLSKLLEDYQVKEKLMESQNPDSEGEDIEMKYAKQIQFLESQISELLSRNSALENEMQEKVTLVQSEFKIELDKKCSEMQSTLKLKESECEKLQLNFSECKKELGECKVKMQEENKSNKCLISQLKNELSLLEVGSRAKIEDLNKKIKQLQQEREQLMIQAQERVAATEVKYREDIKQLNEKVQQLQLQNKEVVKLKNENAILSTQLDESLLVAAANQAQANEELSRLKKQLEELQSELSLKTNIFSEKENELQSKVASLESIKQEKAELNDKITLLEEKSASNRNLEEKIQLLNCENKQMKEELDFFLSLNEEKEQLNVKIQALELSKNELNDSIKKLRAENEDLRTKCNCVNCSCGEIVSLRSEKDSLLKKLEVFESEKLQCLSCDTLKNDINRIRDECEKALRAKDEEIEDKVKLVLKDVSDQISAKDMNCDQTVTELMEKSQNLEEQLQREHRLEIAALRQDIFEKDCALEEMHEHYEGIIKEKDFKILECEENLKSLQGLGKVLSSDSETAGCNEISDWDDTWVVPEENCDNLSPAHNKVDCEAHLQQIECMHKELAKCNSELKDLRILLRLSPPQPLHSNNNYNPSIDVPQPTEFEYLRNILFQYMMGRETVTLVKVIAAVLRFNDEQTRLIVEKEKAKQSAEP